MSGLYFIETNRTNDPRSIAERVSAQLGYGKNPINHYAVFEKTIMGMVSPDNFRQGIMPRYLKEEKLWGVMAGELYESDALLKWRREHPGPPNHLSVFAQMLRCNRLEENLPFLNGAFFVILFDPASKALIAVNDRYGLYPMYWAYSNKGFCLSSRVLSSVLSGVVKGEWNFAGVAQSLTIDDLLGDTTLISGVQAFPQACVMEKNGNDIKFKTYWQYDYSCATDTPAKEELVEELGSRFKKAVRRQCADNRRVGVTLSGGLDSRCIVAAAAAENIPVQTFTWGKPASYDRMFARNVSSVFKTHHHDCDYEYRNFENRFEQAGRITEGMINYFDCHMLAHLHLLEGNVDVVLNGYAGDLVLGGSYLRKAWLKNNSLQSLSKQLFLWRNALLPESGLETAIPELSRLESRDYPSLFFTDLVRELEGCALPDVVDRFFLENRVRRQTAMGTVLIREVTESAACFFDYDLMDLILSIPQTLRYEHQIYLSMMKSSFPEALGIRWQRTLLPASSPHWLGLPAKAFLKACRISENRWGWPAIASRQSPVDFALWLRGPLREFMNRMIYEVAPRASEIIMPAFCIRIWQCHLEGFDQTRLLGAILSLVCFADALKNTSSAKTQQPYEAVEITNHPS
jgi:asparagine synthase (glutamine-hydrolysing)